MYLKEYWYIAAKSKELGSQPISRTLLGEPLVLFRGKDGSPAALIDRCAHRNMALSLGQVRNGCVQCPYHGWKYGADGKCSEIPSLSVNSSIPPNARVRAYPVEESDGVVWVYLGLQTPKPLPRFPHCMESGWMTFTMKTRFPANALACLENFLDCPHTTYVHRGWFRSNEAHKVNAKVRYGKESVEVEFFNERDAKSVVSRLLFPSNEKMTHTDKFFMPATSRVDYVFSSGRHFIITSQCTPISEHETEVYTVITFRFGRISPLVRLFFEPLCRRIIRQDVDILHAQSEQLRRFAGPQFTFIETDLVAPHMWKLWRVASSLEQGGPMDELNLKEEKEIVLQF